MMPTMQLVVLLLGIFSFCCICSLALTSSEGASSCHGLCGGIAGDCSCMNDCHTFNDCCNDIVEACDAEGTCAGGLCGQQSLTLCFCDATCIELNDCCSDYEDVCVAPSCAGHCGGQSDGGCWCDDNCEEKGDCCHDRLDVCEEGDLPDPLRTCCEGITEEQRKELTQGFKEMECDLQCYADSPNYGGVGCKVFDLDQSCRSCFSEAGAARQLAEFPSTSLSEMNLCQADQPAEAKVPIFMAGDSEDPFIIAGQGLQAVEGDEGCRCDTALLSAADLDVLADRDMGLFCDERCLDIFANPVGGLWCGMFGLGPTCRGCFTTDGVARYLEAYPTEHCGTIITCPGHVCVDEEQEEGGEDGTEGIEGGEEQVEGAAEATTFAPATAPTDPPTPMGGSEGSAAASPGEAEEEQQEVLRSGPSGGDDEQVSALSITMLVGGSVAAGLGVALAWSARRNKPASAEPPPAS